STTSFKRGWCGDAIHVACRGRAGTGRGVAAGRAGRRPRGRHEGAGRGRGGPRWQVRGPGPVHRPPTGGARILGDVVSAVQGARAVAQGGTRALRAHGTVRGHRRGREPVAGLDQASSRGAPAAVPRAVRRERRGGAGLRGAHDLVHRRGRQDRHGDLHGHRSRAGHRGGVAAGRERLSYSPVFGVTRSIAPASSLYACGSISRNGAITCAIFPSGPTTNRLRLSSPYLGLWAPYVLPITPALSLANRYGNSSSRAHAASVSAGSRLMAMRTTLRPS